VKLEGKEVLCLDNADIYLCYKDFWLTDKEIMQHTTASNLKTPQKFSLAQVTPQRKPNLMPRSRLHSATGSPFLWILRFSRTTARFARWGSLIGCRLSSSLTTMPVLLDQLTQQE